MVTVTKALLTMAVIGGGGGMLLYSSVKEAEYYKHVHEVTAEPERWVGKSLKVHGFVEAGSIHEEIVDQATVRSFVLEYQGERILIRHQGPKPDTFRDLSEVVAQGELVIEDDGQRVLHADKLMAKCPSKYEQNNSVGATALGATASPSPASQASSP